MSYTKGIVIQVVDNGYYIAAQNNEQVVGQHIAITKEQVISSVQSLLEILEKEGLRSR